MEGGGMEAAKEGGRNEGTMEGRKEEWEVGKEL